jgi:RES domain-containing protein
MLCYRLTRFPDLTGEGGRLVSGRWHSAGSPIIYAAESDALCILEVRVNLDIGFDLLPLDYRLQIIEIDHLYQIETAEMSPSDPGTRAFGDAWLAASSAGTRSPILRVRSIVAPSSHNLLLNPMAPKFAAAVRTRSANRFEFDPRLWGVG